MRVFKSLFIEDCEFILEDYNDDEFFNLNNNPQTPRYLRSKRKNRPEILPDSHDGLETKDLDENTKGIIKDEFLYY